MSIESVQTGGGDDFIVGSNGFNRIESGDGADFIRGLGGDDVILGGAGDDIIIGGTGDDHMFGQAGSDEFEVSVGEGHDRISGFNVFFDFVDLQGTSFTDFASIQAAFVDSMGYTTLVIDGSTSIRFDGLQASDFSSDNFQLDGGAVSSEALDKDTSDAVAAESLSDFGDFVTIAEPGASLMTKDDGMLGYYPIEQIDIHEHYIDVIDLFVG